MDPLTVALASAVIQGVATLIQQVQQGKITDAQAQEILQKGVSHFNASEAAWDATQAPAAKGGE